MRALIVVAFLVAAWTPAFARTNEEIATHAEAAFRQGVENKERFLVARKHFSAATDAYLELHQRGVRNPKLYLNLGNAAALADRWPVAIWAYHAGLKLDPDDGALRDHLAFVRGKVSYPASGLGRPEPDYWPMWLHRPSIRELFGISVISYVIAWVAATCTFFRRTARLFALTLVALAVASASGVGLWYELQQAEFDRATPLVIVAENTPLYRGNGPSYPPHAELPFLPRGMEVRQLHRRGGWLQVRLSSGEIGWLPLERVLVVEPCIE